MTETSRAAGPPSANRVGELTLHRYPASRMATGPDEALSYRIHQATGMVAAQVGCGIDEALARRRIRASSQDQSLEETALDVLDGEVRFDD